MNQRSDLAYKDVLRNKAETALSSSGADIERLPLNDLQSLFHELQVHQIELQMQNEELLETQMRLQVSQENYSELYELAPVGYLTLDSNSSIQTANLTACKLFGRGRQALNGTNFSRHFIAEDQDNIYRTFRRLFLTNETQSLDCRLLNESKHNWMHMECSVRTSNSQEWLVTLTDISERKQAEEQLRELQRQFAHVARLSCMNELASGIAHEVAQPLSVITASSYSCELLLTQAGTDRSEELTGVVQTITEQAEHAGEILQRVRSFVDPSNANRTTLDINKLVDEALKLTAYQARTLGAKVHLALAENIRVKGDRVQIHQVIANLLLNAFESMENQLRERRCVTIRSFCKGDNVEVSVEDSGKGLSCQSVASVFDPFVTTKTTGMGLGLAITRSIIESHGGKIWVTPKVNQGTIFHFTLPIKECASTDG